MESAHVRALLQRAQAHAKSVRELDPASEANTAFVGLVELSRLVRSRASSVQVSPLDMPHVVHCKPGLSAVDTISQLGVICFGEQLSSVCQVRASVAHLPENTRGIWEQRCTWLHDELVALAAERLQSDDSRQFWLNVVALLYLSAERLEVSEAARLEAEKARAEAHAETERAKQAAAASAAALAAAERTISELMAAAAGGDGMDPASLPFAQPPFAGGSAQPALLPPAVPDSMAPGLPLIPSMGSMGDILGDDNTSVLELRTRLVVQQQEIQRRAADSAALMQRLHQTAAERARLEAEAAKVRGEAKALEEDLDRQAEVIAALMERTDSLMRDQGEGSSKRRELAEANNTLSTNLEQHAAVVEKLIGLNAELMERANWDALQRDRAGEGAGGAAGAPSTAPTETGETANGARQDGAGPAPTSVSVIIGGGGDDAGGGEGCAQQRGAGQGGPGHGPGANGNGGAAAAGGGGNLVSLFAAYLASQDDDDDSRDHQQRRGPALLGQLLADRGTGQALV